tara:strand:+ start:486 stop:2336 length:1851 start_codon:yes stop_codon:yes gene_type:complete
MNPKLPAIYIPVLIFLTVFVLNIEARESSSGITRILNQIASQFQQTEGYVVARVGDELILDLKQGQSVKAGDLLKIMRYGEELNHPLTGKGLGRMETDLGEIRILEVRKNFTRAKALDSDLDIRKGDGVRSRFQKITILPAPIDLKASSSLDAVALMALFEKKISNHPRFTLPNFELKVWLLESGFSLKDLQRPEILERMGQKVSVDYILFPKVRELKGKRVLEYRLTSIVDGSLARKGKVILAELPTRTSVDRLTTKAQNIKPDIRFNPNNSKGVDFVGKQTFDFEIVDFDVGDLNGDGKMEYVVASPDKLFVYNYGGKKFHRIAQVSRQKGENVFLSVDVGDINGNGKAEVFVTNKYIDRLGSFVLEYRGKKMATLWEKVDSYFRILRSFSGQFQLVLQKAGVDKPFNGDIFPVKFKNGSYVEGEPFKLSDNDDRRMQFMLYGMNRLDLESDENIETIILDNDYHLRVYSPTGDLLLRSDEYYGHDPRVMDIGIRATWAEMADMPGRVSPVHFKGRLALRESQGRRFLLVPRNHRLGGQFLERTVIINNCGLVIFELVTEGLKKVFELEKQKGYIAAYRVVGEGDNSKIHLAAVSRGKFGRKTKSTIFTYDWTL